MYKHCIRQSDTSYISCILQGRNFSYNFIFCTPKHLLDADRPSVVFNVGYLEALISNGCLILSRGTKFAQLAYMQTQSNRLVRVFQDGIFSKPDLVPLPQIPRHLRRQQAHDIPPCELEPRPQLRYFKQNLNILFQLTPQSCHFYKSLYMIVLRLRRTNIHHRRLVPRPNI